MNEAINLNRPLVRDDVVRIHAQEASFVHSTLLWARDSPNYRPLDIYDLESRLKAHLRALVIAGQAGMDMALDELNEEPGSGEMFTAVVLALRTGRGKVLDDLLDQVGEDEDFRLAVSAAASSCPPDILSDFMSEWLVGPLPELSWIALDICGAHRVNPGERLNRLVEHHDLSVRLRACQLAGELGRVDLLPNLQEDLGTDHGFSSAWAATLLGNNTNAPELLADGLVPGISAYDARRAAELVPLALDPQATQSHVKRLLRDPLTQRWAMVMLGALGAPETLEWLVGQMDDPLLARSAGAAFAQITGVDIAHDDLELDEFPDDPEDPSLGEDLVEETIEGNSPWPDRQRVEDWLKVQGGRFAPSTRHLLGVAAWTLADPPDQMVKFQGQFRAVAFEHAMRNPARALPNWRGPVRQNGNSFERDW